MNRISSCIREKSWKLPEALRDATPSELGVPAANSFSRSKLLVLLARRLFCSRMPLSHAKSKIVL
jgi:hypothetical protein